MPLLRSSKCPAAVALAIAIGAALPASTANAADPPRPGAESPQPTSVYTREGILGSVRAGPTVGAGAPDGVRLGMFAKWRGLLGAGVAMSLLPETSIPGMDAKVVRASGEAFARVHPFRGALFLGVAGGYAQTKGTAFETKMAFHQTQRVETHAYASAVYIAPQVGFQWMHSSGLTIGFDLGAEIPVATNGPTFDAARYGLVVPVDGKGNLADTTRSFTTMVIPVVHLLELGYAL